MVSAVKGLLYREFMQYYNSMHWHIGVGFPAFSAAQLCDCHAQWEQEPKGKEHEYAMKVGKTEPRLKTQKCCCTGWPRFLQHLQITSTCHPDLIHQSLQDRRCVYIMGWINHGWIWWLTWDFDLHTCKLLVHFQQQPFWIETWNFTRSLNVRIK